MQWPTEQLQALLSGETQWNEASPAIRSWAAFFIYRVALSILNMPKEKRRAAIDRTPASIRPHLEAEIIRLHRLPR